MAFFDKRIWICPALCGCELEITAQWPKAPERVDGRDIGHQHPIPRTITRIDLVQNCAAHEAFKTEPLPADPYGGSPGYFDPALATTPAEKLYVRLFRYTGQVLRPDTCGCRVYEVHDRLGVENVRRPAHAKHTRLCASHPADTDHGSAIAENVRKNTTIATIRTTHPTLLDDDITWSFDAQRVLNIVVPKLTQAQVRAFNDANPTNVRLSR